MPKSRTPLMIGWEAARANAKPALIIQAIMLALAIAFYTNSSVADALRNLAEFKRAHGLMFVVCASVFAGAILPEIFLVLFFQRGRPQIGNLRNLAFTIPVWGFDGSLVDLLYRTEANWLGDVATVPIVLGKIFIDQFGYNVLFAAPFGVLTYEWKNSGISIRPIRDLFTWPHYRDNIFPTLLARLAPCVTLVAPFLSLPLAFQYTLFALDLSFWVILLPYITNLC